MGKNILKIGNLKLPSNIVLAPMAGITDLPFRILCKEYGCPMTYTEMVSAKGLYYGSEKTEEMLMMHREERPIGVQIFGREPDIMGLIAEKISRENIDLIDINMGCPAPKITRTGQGSALMKEPKRVGVIIRSVVKNSCKPVTIKIRQGWDDSQINAVKIAKIAEEEGVSAITVHGRTREQFYSGKADWDIIGEVRQSVDIPVIGNGDIFTPEDALSMLQYTGCHGVMIARGAQGQPWIFKRIIHYIGTGEILSEPSCPQRIDIALRHLALAVDIKGARTGVIEMRKHLAWYLKGMKGANPIKDRVNKAESKEEVEDILLEYSRKLKNQEY